MCQFIACFSIECDNMPPVARCCAEPFAHRIVADIAELFGIVRIISQARIPEIFLEMDSAMLRYIVLPMLYHMR